MFGLGRALPIQYTSGPEGLIMAIDGLVVKKKKKIERQNVLPCAKSRQTVSNSNTKIRL